MDKKTTTYIVSAVIILVLSSYVPYRGEKDENIDMLTNSGMAQKAIAAETAISQFVKNVWVTAYTRSPEETDDTPFETAAMTETRDGIIAANFLPFGTKVLIPELFGDKVFTVEDRMHRRKTNFVDVWMENKEDALRLGITYTEIVILNEV